MKRSGLRSRPKPHTSIELVLARDFRKAIVKGYCAAPWCREGATDAHHIVYEQELRKCCLPRWDRRDGIALCRPCHDAHHNASRRIPLSALPDQALEFAFEQLGPRAYDYLKRRYSGHDPRMEWFLEQTEEAA